MGVAHAIRRIPGRRVRGVSLPHRQSIGVTLLSGGLDSTTVTAYARSQVQCLSALTFRYGQANSREVWCAREVARMLDVQHELVDISTFGKVAWYSALTSPGRFPIPQDRLSHTAGPADHRPGALSAGVARGEEPDAAGPAIPSTYVPLRNTFFLTLAGALLESQALHAIEAEGLDPRELRVHIFIAPNAIDYSGYPDCRPEYYQKMEEVMRYGSKLWAQYHVPFRIETPIIHLSKAEIVNLGVELGAPLAYTWSCYHDGESPCGRCDSCVLRARGFAEAGLEDPLLVRLQGASP